MRDVDRLSSPPDERGRGPSPTAEVHSTDYDPSTFRSIARTLPVTVRRLDLFSDLRPDGYSKED